MPQLLKSEEFMDILAKYNCQQAINETLTGIIIDSRSESGRIRELLEIVDNRRFVLGRLPDRYFDAAFDFRWTRRKLISAPGRLPEEDKLEIRILAAEELTNDEFNTRIELKEADILMREAVKIINPDK
jgi:hypothetical protein